MHDRSPEREEPILAPTKKLFADSLFISLAQLLVRLKGVVFIPLIVSAVGFADYGAFIQIFLIAKLIASLCSLELGMGFERFVSPIARDDTRTISRHFSSVLGAALTLAALGAAGMFALSPWLSALFLDHSHVDSLRIAALVVLSNTVHGAVRAFLWSRRSFARQSAFTVAYELTPYVGFVVATSVTGRLLPGILAYTLLDAAAAGGMLVYALRGLVFERPSAAIVKAYARYTAPLALSNLEGGLLDRADRFFIAGFLGLESVGLYNIAYRCTALVGFPSVVMRPQMMAYLSAAWDRGAVAETKDVVRTAIISFLSITIGLVSCLAAFSEGLFSHFLGDSAALDHLELMVILIGTGILANCCRRFLAVFARLNHRTRDEFVFQLVGLVLNLAGNIMLIPTLGLPGAAVSTLIAYVAILPLYAREYRPGFDRAFYGHVASFALVAVAVGCLSLLVPTDNLAVLLTGAGLSYLTYLVLIVLFKRRFFLDLRRQLVSWQRQPC